MIQWSKLEDLYESIRVDPFWTDLRRGKNRLVPGEGGTPRAILIGEAPGATEAMHLRPFIGDAGQVLRQLMFLCGLSTVEAQIDNPEYGGDWTKANCWLTNVVKYRPPKNRTPLWTEVLHARAELRQEYRFIGKPRLIVLLGGTALSAYYGRPMSIMKEAGRVRYKPSNVAAPRLAIWPMFHPSFGLRNPNIRSTMENHWEHLAQWMDDDNNQRFLGR